jgi:PAS domain S-box-containing protein
MERKRLDKEPEAETPLPHLHRASSMPASTSPPAQGPHAREGISGPSPRRDREHSAWTGADLAMHLPARMRDVLKRYGLALALASLMLFLRSQLPLREGTAVYQLPIAAVVLSAWYGGRGPGLFAALVSAAGLLYWIIPPSDSFELPPDYALGFSIFIALCLLLSEFSAGRRRAEHALRATDHELRRAHEELEARHANLLDVTHDAIFARDMNDVITYWNRGAQELMGWTAAQAVGKNAHELLRTVFPCPVEQIRAELLRTGRWEGELTKTRADGTQVVVASRWSLQRDADGRPMAILDTYNDITERKRSEGEIRKLNAQLERRSIELEASNKELEAFAYSASHDLRAPLRHVAAYAELLQKAASSVLDERSRRYVANLLESAKKMGTLIDDLLAFSRIGRVETRMTLVSLGELLREVLRDVERETDGRDIAWKVGAPLPSVHGDRSMLKLALFNLVSNAVKFTRPRPHAEIEIGCRNGASEDVVMFVRDNGVGFDMKYANKLFGVFQRLHLPEDFEGTGIGLATVQRIINRHSGRVWAEGVVDGGATFYFSLPKP